MKIEKYLPYITVAIVILILYKQNHETFEDNLGWWPKNKHWPD